MKPRLLAALLLLGALSCAKPAHEYDNGDLDLVAAFTAKEMCSCLFVVGQTEAFCRQFIKQDPPVATISIDTGKKEVTSHALFNTRRARLVSDRLGCRLE